MQGKEFQNTILGRLNKVDFWFSLEERRNQMSVRELFADCGHPMHKYM